MNVELERFEDDLRTVLADAESCAPMRDDLPERLLATVPVAAPRRWESVRRGGLLPPLLVAAVIAALAAGAVAVTASIQADPKPAMHPTAPPVPTPSVLPSLSTSSIPTSTSTQPSPTVQSKTAVADRPLPAGFHAADVSFVDAQLGWALGNVPCATEPGFCATVARTTDGGRSWRAVPAPKGLTPVNGQGRPGDGSCFSNGTHDGPCVNHIAFADARHGFLWGFSSTYSTADGGATWIDQHTRGSQLAFVGDSVLRWSPIEDCSAGCPGALQRAALGSNEWKTVTPGGRSVSLFDSWLLGNGTTAYFYAFHGNGSRGTGDLYRSTEGGRTWQRRSTPCDSRLNAMSAGADASVMLRCWSAHGDSPVLVSTDGGSSFVSRSSPGTGTYTALFVASGQVVVAEVWDSDATPSFQRSTDGAASWQKIHVSDSGVEYRGFFDGQHGYLLRWDGSVVKTADGGTSWTSLQFD